MDTQAGLLFPIHVTLSGRRQPIFFRTCWQNGILTRRRGRLSSIAGTYW